MCQSTAELKTRKNFSENDTFTESKRLNCCDFPRICLVVILSEDTPLNVATVKTDLGIYSFFKEHEKYCLLRTVGIPSPSSH